jgi:hypothetical protein
VTRRKTPQNISAELLDAMPRKVDQPGDLDSIADLQREWQRLHRFYWRNRLPREQFSASLYSLQTGTQITRMRDELAHAKEELARLADLREQLARLRGAPALDYLPAGTGDVSSDVSSEVAGDASLAVVAATSREDT